MLRTTLTALLLAACLGGLDALGQDAPSLKEKGEKVQQKQLEKFDANGNGTLDPEELAAMKEHRKKEKEERLKQFDANGDGKLDAAEKAKLKAAKKDGVEHKPSDPSPAPANGTPSPAQQSGKSGG